MGVPLNIIHFSDLPLKKTIHLWPHVWKPSFGDLHMPCWKTPPSPWVKPSPLWSKHRVRPERDATPPRWRPKLRADLKQQTSNDFPKIQDHPRSRYSWSMFFRLSLTNITKFYTIQSFFPTLWALQNPHVSPSLTCRASCQGLVMKLAELLGEHRRRFLPNNSDMWW